MHELINRIGCRQLVVTRGRRGATVTDPQGNFVDVPSFARNVVDRVGAGDAFFAITSMASVLGTSNEVLGFIGNVAGSLAVEIVGNKKAIDKLAAKKYITSLMK
jgi:sugar/nucleoside kinase (ribokinase family)